MTTTETNGSMEPVEIEQPSQSTTTHTHNHNPHQPPRRQVSNIPLPKKQSPIAGACSNLVNSIVGAGIIGIPFAFRESGLVAGVILLILVSYFTDKTLRMLVELAFFSPRLKDYGVMTFEDLLAVSVKCCGKRKSCIHASLMVPQFDFQLTSSFSLVHFLRTAPLWPRRNYFCPYQYVHHSLRSHGGLSLDHQGYVARHLWSGRFTRRWRIRGTRAVNGGHIARNCGAAVDATGL